MTPMFGKNAVVFSSDNTYATYLGVAIKSLIENSSAQENYDIVIFDGGISQHRKDQLLSLAERRSNISVRFFDIISYTKDIAKDFYSSAQSNLQYISIATFYRFFISDIFAAYEKVLYADCDLVFVDDVNKVFCHELDDAYLGVVHDAAFSGEKINPFMLKHVKETLKLQDFHNYFNAGVLLFNQKRLKGVNFSQRCMDKLREIPDLILMDQDVLNLVCENKVKYLDRKWNVQWEVLNSDFTSPKVAEMAIIHYISGQKAWNAPHLRYAEYFWKYARLCPFYEEILFKEYKNSMRLIKDRDFIKKRFTFYRILEKITFGNLRRKYSDLKKKYKYQLKEIASY